MLEDKLNHWRAFLLDRLAIAPGDADALTERLHAETRKLRDAGLQDDEALLIAVKRLGERDAELGAVARAYAEPLCRRLTAAQARPAAEPGWNSGAGVALTLAIAAAVCLKIPELFGLRLEEDGAASFYVRNVLFFVLPWLAAYFAWLRSLAPGASARLATPFVAGLLLLNLYPFVPGGSTEALAALHLPVALWLAVGYAHAAGRWRDHARRMDFVRFSGEWFILYTLIALGGGVLTLFTVFIFDAIGFDAEPFLATWVIPCGAAGAVLIAAWLVDARQRVVANLAPVLTLLFTPLFTFALLAFLGTVLWTGRGIHVERDILIGFDLLLVLVAGLFLYAVSARDAHRGPGLIDALALVMLLCALVVDGLALSAMLARISGFGFSPNRLAALGLNLILVVSLARAALLQGRFLARRTGFDAVVRWQTAFLPVYALWAWVVVALFPPLFRFV